MFLYILAICFGFSGQLPFEIVHHEKDKERVQNSKNLNNKIEDSEMNTRK